MYGHYLITQFLKRGFQLQGSNVGSFNGKLRRELLGIDIFSALLDAKKLGRGQTQGLQSEPFPLITGIHDVARIQEKLAPQ